MASELLEIGALALAATGIGFAARQFRDARTQINELKTTGSDVKDSLGRLETVVTTLDLVAHALPTRVLGEWPDYLDDLALMIDRTASRLTILCDHPAYGIFSNPDGHNKYRRAIERRLVEGVSVRAIFLTPEKRLAINDEFFPQEVDWDDTYRGRVERFVQSRHDGASGARGPVGRLQFHQLLEASDVSVLQGFDSAALLGSNDRGVQILSRKETTSLLPLYFWVRDGVEAVFAIAVHEGGHKEIAFITIDRGLIKALEAAWGRYAEQPDACTRELAPPWPQQNPILGRVL